MRFVRTCRVYLLLLSLCAGGTHLRAACHVKGCPPYTTQKVALPQNQNIGVVVTSSLPGNASQPLTNALQTVSSQSGSTQNGTGDTFTQYASDDAAFTAVGGNGAVVNVNFDTTTTNPVCGNKTDVVGCSSYTSDAGSTVTNYGTITVYLNAQTCGGPCFNPNQAGYAAAVQGVIEHELYHGLGIGDTSSTGYLMSPFVGLNNQNGTTSPQPCDRKETQRAAKQRATGQACS